MLLHIGNVIHLGDSPRFLVVAEDQSKFIQIWLWKEKRIIQIFQTKIKIGKDERKEHKDGHDKRKELKDGNDKKSNNTSELKKVANTMDNNNRNHNYVTNNRDERDNKGKMSVCYTNRNLASPPHYGNH